MAQVSTCIEFIRRLPKDWQSVICYGLLWSADLGFPASALICSRSLSSCCNNVGSPVGGCLKRKLGGSGLSQCAIQRAIQRAIRCLYSYLFNCLCRERANVHHFDFRKNSHLQPLAATCGCLGKWLQVAARASGCLGKRLLGQAAAWASGCKGKRLLGQAAAWASGCLGKRLLGQAAAWASGCLGKRLLGQVAAWASGCKWLQLIAAICSDS